MIERPCPEFECCECGRHVLVLVGALSDTRLCAACLMMPGWFREPQIRAAIDPTHDGRDRAEAMPCHAMMDHRCSADELNSLRDKNYFLRARIKHLEHALTEILPVQKEWRLTTTEAAVFGVLVNRPLAHRDAIMAAIHRYPTKYQPLPTSVDVYLYKLRRKLTRHGVSIATVFGLGYRLDPATKPRFNARPEPNKGGMQC